MRSRLVAVAGATLALAACSGGSSTPASSAGTPSSAGAPSSAAPTRAAGPSKAATTKAYTDESLAALIPVAPEIDGKGATARSTDEAEQTRSEHGRLATILGSAKVEPSACKPHLVAYLEADASDGAMAVGSYAGSDVELHAFPDPQAAHKAVSAIAQASGACEKFTASLLGQSVDGSVQGAPIDSGVLDTAYGAIVQLKGGGRDSAEARLTGVVGNVLVVVHAAPGTKPDLAKKQLEGLAAAVRADLGS